MQIPTNHPPMDSAHAAASYRLAISRSSPLLLALLFFSGIVGHNATPAPRDLSSIPAPAFPSSTTFKLRMANQLVFVRRVEVFQLEMSKLDRIVHKCPTNSTFVVPGINEFRLNWRNCRILPGVDTIQMVIYFATSAHEPALEATYNVEFHGEHAFAFFNSEYQIDMKWLVLRRENQREAEVEEILTDTNEQELNKIRKEKEEGSQKKAGE